MTGYTRDRQAGRARATELHGARRRHTQMIRLFVRSPFVRLNESTSARHASPSVSLARTAFGPRRLKDTLFNHLVDVLQHRAFRAARSIGHLTRANRDLISEKPHNHRLDSSRRGERRLASRKPSAFEDKPKGTDGVKRLGGRHECACQKTSLVRW